MKNETMGNGERKTWEAALYEIYRSPEVSTPDWCEFYHEWWHVLRFALEG
jgi:hypothetical protein